MPPLTVTSPNDDGQKKLNTLSLALNTAQSGQTILFNVPGKVITVSGQLPASTNPGVIISGGNCGTAPITLQGSAGVTNGLTLNKGGVMRNLLIKGFGKKQIMANPALAEVGAVVLQCSKALK